MTAKYFVILNQFNGDLTVECSAFLSRAQIDYAKGKIPQHIVLAQADEREQADQFLALLKNVSTVVVEPTQHKVTPNA